MFELDFKQKVWYKELTLDTRKEAHLMASESVESIAKRLCREKLIAESDIMIVQEEQLFKYPTLLSTAEYCLLLGIVGRVLWQVEGELAVHAGFQADWFQDEKKCNAFNELVNQPAELPSYLEAIRRKVVFLRLLIDEIRRVRKESIKSKRKKRGKPNSRPMS